MAEWRNGGMAEWRNGGMAEWRDGGIAGNDGMASIWMMNVAEWWNGGMEKWRDGYLPTTFMVHADDNDTDTF